jgi:type I restriction enzyme M protein
MTKYLEYSQRTKDLIDSLKAICTNYGLGNTGYEYRIITEVFLYKFLNDKFYYEARKADKSLGANNKIEDDLQKMSDSDYEYLLEKIGPRTAKFSKTQFISCLWNRQNEKNFAESFDNTLIGIADLNIKLYSVSTISGERIRLFDRISHYIIEGNEKSPFCRAIINKLVGFSFEPIFDEKYDFFSSIFEHLIKDYNKDSGKYAEYYTPPAVATIMAKILAPHPIKNVTLYDPCAGSGTLLMALAHQIGEARCTLYTQDISQKSSEFLRLNLVLNNLVHSLHNVVKGNTLKDPFYLNDSKTDLRQFNLIVSNPPFKMDFSDDRETLASDKHRKRFFLGVPAVPKKKKDSMAVYLLFVQHIMYSLSKGGRAAIVVPTGFCSEKSGIAKKIKQEIVDKNWLHAVIHMPPNIFATTGTNVSVIFIDKSKNNEQTVLVDASNLGVKIKDRNNQKTLLLDEDQNSMVNAVNNGMARVDFSAVVDRGKIKANNYSLAAGQYFEINPRYCELTPQEFNSQLEEQNFQLKELFNKSHHLENNLFLKLKEFRYDI